MPGGGGYHIKLVALLLNAKRKQLLEEEALKIREEEANTSWKCTRFTKNNLTGGGGPEGGRGYKNI